MIKKKNIEERTYVIDMHSKHEMLVSQVDNFWNFIYTDYQIKEISADDDGKIFYTVKEGA